MHWVLGICLDVFVVESQCSELSCFPLICVFGLKVSDFGFRAQGLRFKVWRARCRG